MRQHKWFNEVFAVTLLLSIPAGFCSEVRADIGGGRSESSQKTLLEKIKKGGSLKGLNILIKTKKPLRSDKPGTFMPSMGAGDIFQFLTYAQELQDRGANVVYDTPGYLKHVIGGGTDIKVRPQDGVEYEEVELSTLYDELRCIKKFKERKPLFNIDAATLKKWEKFVDKYAGDDMPVIFFWNCAKNHRPDRALTPRLTSLVKEMKGVKFFDLEFRSPYVFPNVVKPSALEPEFDKKSFADTAALLYVVLSRGGKVIAPDSGTLHLSAQVARHLCKKCVYACLPKKPNERWNEDKYKGNSKKSCAWYATVSLFRQESYESREGGEAWKPVVKDIRKNLKQEAKRYKERRNQEGEEKAGLKKAQKR